jgi:hypothetical protein
MNRLDVEHVPTTDRDMSRRDVLVGSAALVAGTSLSMAALAIEAKPAGASNPGGTRTCSPSSRELDRQLF